MKHCPTLLAFDPTSIAFDPTLLAFVLLLIGPFFLHASEPTAANLAAFNTASQEIKLTLDARHRSTNFLGLTLASRTSLLHGSLIIERLPTTSGNGLSGALLHHWRATLFVPKARANDFEPLMRDFNHYPQVFAPEALQASAQPASQPGHILASIRIRQHHILTVVLDATYDVTFARLDPAHGYSISRSRRIDEVESPGTPAEHILSPAENHGFLWRQDTFWSYEERDGGLYLQLESLSLTRDIPTGLGWAVRPFIESIPRDSLEFTLRSAAKALHK